MGTSEQQLEVPNKFTSDPQNQLLSHCIRSPRGGKTEDGGICE